jgi:hypothetical protein
VSWRDERGWLRPDEREVAQFATLPARKVAARVLSGDRRTARWIGPMFILFAVILVGWIVILAVTLPRRGILHNEDFVWVGFDGGLLLGLAWTAWAALQRRPSLPLAAAATGACLITDAWFDVIGSDPGDRMVAIAMAVIVELPLASLCWWLALHAQELAEQRISRMVLRWRETMVTVREVQVGERESEVGAREVDETAREVGETAREVGETAREVGETAREVEETDREVRDRTDEECVDPLGRPAD